MVARASFFSAFVPSHRLVLTLWLALSGCAKSEASGSTANTTTANTTTATPSAAASTNKTAPAESATQANTGTPECGAKPLPDCPLQAWMKANTSAQLISNDFAALASALDKTTSFAPAGYTNWASISKDGAAAARTNDMGATKASCRSCHEQYKDKYKKELRARKL